MTSSSSREKKDEFSAFSGIVPSVKRRKVSESSTLYDVFINHRAPGDAKLTLATDLYNSLKERDIRAFLDVEEKDLGLFVTSIIETAILSASVHIAIFSKGYAESPWCLAELELMLQSSAKIIPVFYEVEPWELRHIGMGAYADAFMKYEQKGRYLEKLPEWKEALNQVSFMAGAVFKSSNSFNDCKIIVAAVEQEVRRKKLLYVAKYPVGLPNLVSDFERCCVAHDFKNQLNVEKPEEGKDKINIVGILSMGGMGKTTLAKVLFNLRRSEYSRASFLFDVREASMKGQLSILQCKLAKDLFDVDIPNFRSPEEGTSYLRNCIARSSSSSFYIVLDDIDHVDQLDVLLIMDIINKTANSMAIVTTRDASVLINARIDVCYKLKAMDRTDARELFCWHAFGQSIPYSGFESLVDDFVDVCGGLPLSLQILGSHVHGGSDVYWRSELSKVQKTLPSGVTQRLKTSFDALDSEAKQVFMDIACFFVGKPTSIAETVIKGSGWNTQLALETLKGKCLVEEIQTSSLNKAGETVLTMHDHLRDLGREMADELSHPHRLWQPQDLRISGLKNILALTNVRCFHSIFEESTGFQFTFFFGQSDATPVSFLWLQIERISREEPSSILQAPSQLKELRISTDEEAVGSMMNENELKGKISSLPEDLEFLRWEGFPLRNLPSWLKLRNLRVLELHDAKELEELWEEKMHAPLHLRELIITGTWSASFNRFPSSISHLTYLTTISLLGDFGREFGIKGLPEEFCYLQSLAHLELRHCALLSSLPARFGDLRNLRHLDLSSSKELRILPDSFKHLAQLQHLDLSDCAKLTLQRDIFENIRNLKNLCLSGCLKLRHLPDQISDQGCLRVLRLQDTRLDIVPPNIGQLRELEVLTIGSPYLTSLPDSLGNLSSLKSLSIIDCVDLTSLPQTLDRLSHLEHLRIESSGITSLPEGLKRLANLQSLKISGCPVNKLDFESGSSALRNLRIIEISETCWIGFQSPKIVVTDLKRSTLVETTI